MCATELFKLLAIYASLFNQKTPKDAFIKTIKVYFAYFSHYLVCFASCRSKHRLQKYTQFLTVVCSADVTLAIVSANKKHLKNVGPIHPNEPLHSNSPDVASGTVARCLCIDVHDNDDNA